MNSKSVEKVFSHIIMQIVGLAGVRRGYQVTPIISQKEGNCIFVFYHKETKNKIHPAKLEKVRGTENMINKKFTQMPIIPPDRLLLRNTEAISVCKNQSRPEQSTVCCLYSGLSSIADPTLFPRTPSPFPLYIKPSCLLNSPHTLSLSLSLSPKL